mgnify:CR=1 FL=1
MDQSNVVSKKSKNIDFFRNYKNTKSGYSNWVGVNKREFCVDSFLKMCVGESIGIVDGYEHVLGGAPFPLPALYGEASKGKIGIQIYYIPTVLIAGGLKYEF